MFRVSYNVAKTNLSIKRGKNAAMLHLDTMTIEDDKIKIDVECNCAMRLRDGSMLCSSTANDTMYLIENMAIAKTMKSKEHIVNMLPFDKTKFIVVYFYFSKVLNTEAKEDVYLWTY